MIIFKTLIKPLHRYVFLIIQNPAFHYLPIYLDIHAPIICIVYKKTKQEAKLLNIQCHISNPIFQ